MICNEGYIYINLHTYILIETGIAKNPHMYGDILLTPEQEKVLNIGDKGVAQGIKQGAKLWPNSIVPYQFDFRLSKYASMKVYPPHVIIWYINISVSYITTLCTNSCCSH